MKLNLIDTKLDDTVYEFIDNNFHMQIFNQKLPDKQYYSISTDAWSIIVFMNLCNRRFNTGEILTGNTRQLVSTLESLLNIKLKTLLNINLLLMEDKTMIQQQVDNNKKRLLSLWRSLTDLIHIQL